MLQGSTSWLLLTATSHPSILRYPFEIPIVQFEDWRLGPICWQPEWGPKPPSFIATGGVGVTASGAPYYRDSTSSYYVYRDPDCDDGNGVSARWIVDGAEPSTTAWSDSTCNYYARIDSADSSSPPIGTASWTVNCDGSWIVNTLTLSQGHLDRPCLRRPRLRHHLRLLRRRR